MNRIGGHSRFSSPLWRSHFSIAVYRPHVQPASLTLKVEKIANKAIKKLENQRAEEGSAKPVYGFRMPEEGEPAFDKWMQDIDQFLSSIKD